MKKLFAALLTTVSVSSSYACMGGDLIQVIIERGGQKLVVAEYDKKSGMRVYENKNVDSIRTTVVEGSSACTTGSCNQLMVMEERRVQFQIELNDGTSARKKISKVTVNPDLPATKAYMQLESQMEVDSEGRNIHSCSTK